MSNYSSDSEKRISNPPYDHHESDDDDDDDSGDDDTGSLADLTNYSRGSQGSGVELHPHHSKRGLRHGGGDHFGLLCPGPEEVGIGSCSVCQLGGCPCVCFGLRYANGRRDVLGVARHPA